MVPVDGTETLKESLPGKMTLTGGIELLPAVVGGVNVPGLTGLESELRVI